MIIAATGLIELLKSHVQYRIPIYQRRYDWSFDDCSKFLSDIISVAKDTQREQHFVGSVIYKSANNATTVGAVNVNYLIDGQQRITTIMLILWALAHYAKTVMTPEEYENSDYSLEAIKGDYLTNNERHAQTDIYYKLKLIGNDEIAFKAIMNDSPLPKDIGNNKVYDNYIHILNTLSNKQESPDIILSGINQLLIANVSLERQDNPQLLFETVNSTGKSLKEVDKVRNYILMNAGEKLQQQLFENHWQPMEQRLNISMDGGKTLDNFFKYYSGIISEVKIPEKYYAVFKDHYLGITPNGIQSAVEDMDCYSVLYKRWLDSNASQSGTDLLLYRIKETGNDKCIPVVLKVLRNAEMKIISEKDADEILKLLESYIIRREMFGLKSNSIGEAFIKILRHADSLANVKKCIVNELTEKQRMPKDDELKRALETAEFYGLPHDHYILDRIEKHLNPAYMPDHARISIEHIMPQTIESSEELYSRKDYSEKEKKDRDWAKDLGENWKDIHEKYCNTLGNLTLTGYNSQLSNCRFVVKRDMEAKAEDGIVYGYSSSAIRLSQSLRKLDTWGDKEIRSRLDTLLNYIKEIWPYPSVPTESLNQQENEATNCSDETKQIVKDYLFDNEKYTEIKKNRAYKDPDNNNGYVLFSSKMYPKRTEEQYWFGYGERITELISECSKQYFVFICYGKNTKILKLPISFLKNLENNLNATVDKDGNVQHYHIHLVKNLNDQFYILIPKPKSERIDISEYVLSTSDSTHI